MRGVGWWGGHAFGGFRAVIRKIRNLAEGVLKWGVSFVPLSFFITRLWLRLFIIIVVLFIIIDVLFITILSFFAIFITSNELFTQRPFTFPIESVLFIIKSCFPKVFSTLPSSIDYSEGFYSYCLFITSQYQSMLNH